VRPLLLFRGRATRRRVLGPVRLDAAASAEMLSGIRLPRQLVQQKDDGGYGVVNFLFVRGDGAAINASLLKVLQNLRAICAGPNRKRLNLVQIDSRS
jgi:hypothetical protein